MVLPLGQTAYLAALHALLHLPICKLEFWKVMGIQALISCVTVSREILVQEIQIPPQPGWREALERCRAVKEDHREAEVAKELLWLWR